MLWYLVASGELDDTLKELLKIQRKEAIERRLRYLCRSVMLKFDSCGNYFEFDTSIHDVDNAFCHTCGEYVWYDPIEQSEWSLWLLGESTEEILVLEKI